MRSAFFALLSSTLLFGASPSAAIVVRHDIAPEAFRADPAAYPEVFALYVIRENRDCLATLIAPQWAVTAAHCTEDASLVNALAGPAPAYAVEVAGKRRMIDRIIRHPGGEAERVDLALVHLSEPVRDVRPVALYTGGDEVGQRFFVLGWGGAGTGQTGARPSDQVFRVAANRVDEADARRIMFDFEDPATEPSKVDPLEGISGPGDSGGPALFTRREARCVIGVSSGQATRGRPEGQYGVREYYTRVSTVAAWIEHETGGTTQACPATPA